LLQSAVLQQLGLLERYVDEAIGREDPENSRPVHGWQRKERGCIDIMPN